MTIRKERLQQEIALKKKSLSSLILFAVGIVIGCLVIWHAINILLIAFAAILFAIFLNSISTWVKYKLRIPYFLALTIVFFGLLGIFAWLTVLFAPLIGNQLKELVEALPRAFDQLRTSASRYIDFNLLSGKNLTSEFLLKNDKILAQATSIFSFTIGTVTSFVIFFIVGIYLAYSPKLYVKGFLFIIPPKKRVFVENLLNRMAMALRWWLLGKVIAMTTIGIMTFLGLWILKVPLAFILGLLAAFLTFIPYIGPIIAAIPAVLIALTQYPLKAAYVALLYVIIQSIEGYFITPVIDQKTVFLPPALTVMMQVLLGVLIGFLGITLASPLTVVAFVVLRQLYVRSSRKKQF